MKSLRWTLMQYDRDSIKRGNLDTRIDIHRGKMVWRNKQKDGHVKTGHCSNAFTRQGLAKIVGKSLEAIKRQEWILLQRFQGEHSPTETSLVAQMVKHLPIMRETRVQSLGQEDPLEKEKATHSSTLAWKIPWIEEHGRLQPMGSQRVGHDWATSFSFLFIVLLTPWF